MRSLLMKTEPVPKRTAETKILPLRNFDTIFKEHSARVFNTAAAMAGNDQDAEEITQEVFLRIHKYLPSFKGLSSLDTWIYRITMNTVSNFLGKRNRVTSMQVNRSVDELDTLGRLWNARDDVEHAFGTKQLGSALHQALMNLPRHYRAVFVLKEIEGYSYRDISEIIDVPMGTVESRLYRARIMLRQALNGQNIEE